MCPDKQLLSAYCDGEILSPWRKKIEIHLEECGVCRDSVARYRSLSGILQNAENPAPEEAVFARVREKALESGVLRVSLWRKRVSLPLAAAAALIFFGSGVAATLFTRMAPETGSVAESRLRRAEYAAKVRNMDELLNILTEDDSESELTITLPQRNFQAYGKPVFFRAEDLPQEKKR